MPTMWINRDITAILKQNTNFIEIVSGPRQCGKSSLLLQIGPEFIELSFDDLGIRQLANTDPQGLLNQFEGKKVFIDEAQLAPEIFYALKKKVDLMKRQSHSRETIYRLTGSNQILMDKQVKESLAGRASYFELNTLSVAEIFSAANPTMGEIILRGGWPELYSDQTISSKRYLDDYIRTYVEKDIILASGIQKQNEFIRFLKLLAGRTGQLVNHSELSKEVGVSSETIKEWISILERMRIIILVEPFYSNLSKRLIKSPKVFFLDTGLACRLQGHSEISPLLTSPQFGGLFETLVFAEIYKTMKNFDKDWKIHHWRSRDGEEIDFLVEMGNGKSLFIEAKTSPQPLYSHEEFLEVRKVFKEKIPSRFLCHLDGERILGKSIPIKFLRDFLLNY